MVKAKKTATKSNGQPLGFEAKLWAAADALRNYMDAAECKHVVLGLIFLKHISDAFEAKHAELEGQKVEGAEGGALVVPQGECSSPNRCRTAYN